MFCKQERRLHLSFLLQTCSLQSHTHTHTHTLLLKGVVQTDRQTWAAPAGPLQLAACLERADDGIRCVLLHDVFLMNHVELGRRILACKQKNRLLSARVDGQELGDVQHLPIDDDPTVGLLVVSRHFFQRVGSHFARRGSCRFRVATAGTRRRFRRRRAWARGDRGALVISPRNVDGDLLGGRVDGNARRQSRLGDDCLQAGSGTTARSVLRRALARHASVHDAAQQATSTQSVDAVHASGHLAGSVQAADGLPFRRQNRRLLVDEPKEFPPTKLNWEDFELNDIELEESLSFSSACILSDDFGTQVFDC